jgi:hypothetical protein
MKKLIFCCVILISGLPIFSQTSVKRSTDNTQKDWVLVQEANGVSQFIRYSNCNSPEHGFIGEYVQMKLVNNSDAAKTISWDLLLWYNGECINCDHVSDEYHRSMIIPASGIIESGCDHNKNPFLNIYSKSLNPAPDEWELTHFEIRNYTVK